MASYKTKITPDYYGDHVPGDTGRGHQTIDGSERTSSIDVVGSFDESAQRQGHGLRGAADVKAFGSAPRGGANDRYDTGLGGQPKYDRQAHKARAQDTYTPPRETARAKPRNGR